MTVVLPDDPSPDRSIITSSRTPVRHHTKGSVSIAAFCLGAAVHLLTVGRAARSGPPTDITQVVRTAIERSPTLRAARGERAAGTVQADRGRPVAEPSVTASFGLRAQTPSLPFPVGSTGPQFMPARAGAATVSLDQAVYRPGLADASRRHRALRAASDIEYLRAANDLIRDVRLAYITCLTTGEMARLADEAAALAREHAALVDNMVAAGMSATRDAAAARADVAEADEILIRARDGAALALGNLVRLVGTDPGSVLQLPVESTLEAPPPDLEHAQALASSRRPELLGLWRQHEAAVAARRLASLQSAPEISVVAIAAHQTPTAIVPTNWACLGLELRWKALDGGRTKHDVAEASARLDQISALLDEAAAGIRVETDAAWRGIQAARARIELTGLRQALARSAMTVSRARYEQRAATLLELSAARFALSQADAAAAAARHDLLSALVELAHATGGPLETFRELLK